METFGNRLTRLREGKGWTVKEMADKTRASEWSIRLYENGKQAPGFWILLEIAKQLDVSLDYLCGLSEVRKPVVNMLLKDWKERQ